MVARPHPRYCRAGGALSRPPLIARLDPRLPIVIGIIGVMPPTGSYAGCTEEQAVTQIPIQANHIVSDVAIEHAETLEVMQRMGLNRCCGAQLTLAEAAAAAGVPLQALLEALNRPQPASA